MTTVIQLTPQDTIERALDLAAAEGADGCVVLVAETSSANLRWANNTLTTNGAMRGSSVTVIATVGAGEENCRRSGRPLVGHGGGVARGRSAAVAAARAAGPARTPARWSTAPSARLGRGAEETSVNVY